jgi:hypothetical protein
MDSDAFAAKLSRLAFTQITPASGVPSAALGDLAVHDLAERL